MSVQRVNAGTYSEALPSGEWAVYIPARNEIATHLGFIPAPGENLLFLRITATPTFKMAGQGNATGAAWEWTNGVWSNRGTTFGVSPLIYDNDGTLRLATVANGSQGFRYVTPDNRLVTGDETYKWPGGGLWEYTELPVGLVGQGEDGCRFLVNGQLRSLTTGDARFIRAHQVGADVAITVVNLAGGFTTIHRLTESEVRNLPPAPVSPPPPQPPLPPPPPPVPPVMPIPNQLPTVQRIRAKYPTPLAAQHANFLIEVGVATGAKLLRKEAGTNVLLPNGMRCSQDILMFDGEGVDILSDGEGAAIASWQEKGPIAGEYIDPKQFVVTPPPVEPPPPVNPPPPPAPAVDLKPILDAIAQAKQENATNLAVLDKKIEAVMADVAALRVQLAKGFDGRVRVLGFASTFEINPRQ